jgi:phosphate uptake regulator
VAEELRKAFHRDLDEIDHKVRQLFALVGEGLAGATDAFLAGDRDAAKALMDRDRLLDALYADIEVMVQRQFALQSPMAQDMRYLLSVLRIVPELERSGDLAEHIAQRAVRGLLDINQVGAAGQRRLGLRRRADADQQTNGRGRRGLVAPCLSHVVSPSKGANWLRPDGSR